MARNYDNRQRRERPGRFDELIQLAGLQRELSAPGLEERALAERENNNRVQMALQLIGLQQQQQNAQAQRDLMSSQYWEGELPRQYAALDMQRGENELQRAMTQRGQDMTSGQFWEGQLPQMYAALQQQIDQAGSAQALQERLGQMQAAINMFGEAGRFPGATTESALRAGGLFSPQMAQQANTMSAQARAAALQQVAPQLALITDPKAREAHGRAQLAQFPGAYEEALGIAFPPQPNAPTPSPTPSAINPNAPVTPSNWNGEEPLDRLFRALRNFRTGPGFPNFADPREARPYLRKEYGLP